MSTPKVFDLKRQIISIVVIVLLMVFTFLVLNGGAEAISWRNFFAYLRQLEAPVFLFAAIFCVFLSVSSEAASLAFILSKISKKKPTVSGTLVYATADIYFSAITPSATGGQPAAAYYMSKTGYTASKATAALLLNTFQYTLALIILGALGFIISPKVLVGTDIKVKLFVLVAIVFNVFLIILCVFCMVFPNIIRAIGRFGIALLCRLRIFKNRDEKELAFEEYLTDYRRVVKTFSKHPSVWFVPLVFNLLQRLFLYCVPLFVFLAEGGAPDNLVQVLAHQMIVTLGANSVPIPGAMGVSEYLFIVLLGGFFTRRNLSMILVRTISHYFAFISCGIATLLFHIHIRVKKAKSVRRKKQVDEQ